MKDYKWGKFLGIILLSGMVGAVVGGGMRRLEDTVDIERIKIVFNQFVPSLFWIALVCGIIGLVGYAYFNNLLKKDGYSNEEGSLYDRYENRLSKIMIFSTLCAIINFTAIGLNLTHKLDKIYVIVIILNVILSLVGEVVNISLVKKVRPELNADPLDTGFKKEYFDRLDECEKNKVGKASFKTMSMMIPVYVSMFVLCYIVVVVLEVSPIICLPVGILWLIQTLILVYYSCKEK